MQSFEIAPTDEHDEHWEGDFEGEAESDGSDEEAFDGTPAGLSNGNGLPAVGTPSKKKMKKMKVKTHRDYAASNEMINMILYNPRCRGVCCLGTIGCLLIMLFVKLVLPKSAFTGGFEDEDLPQCSVQNTGQPFSEWMHFIRVANDTELCRPEVEEEDCKCHNPFSKGYDDDEDWHKVFDINLHALNETIGKGSPLDLVLYGDSIIERMNGRVFGKLEDNIKDQLAVTKEMFTKEGGGQIEALPLGIAGEEIHTLMYRLQNGEMPDELTPGAWWLMIGTNDVVKNNCNADSVVAGIITVAEEILRKDEINRQYDASHVVINSLFPRLQLYEDPLWPTIQDINRRLECYAQTTLGMEFFNATELFVKTDAATGKSEVDTNMFLSDGIHLTATGTRIWEQAIVEKTKYLVEHNS